ncbi:MAG: ComEA family DNA-binding protein [Limnochordia bacterium]|jgi:comEA protein
MSQRQQVRLLFFLSLVLVSGVGWRWWLVAGPGRSSLEWIGAPLITRVQAAKLPSNTEKDQKASQETEAAAEESVGQRVAETHDSEKASSEPTPVLTVLDLNTATQKELEQLPGIGPVLARSILKERAKRGRFASVEDLLSVKGIGPARYARIAPLVSVIVSTP